MFGFLQESSAFTTNGRRQCPFDEKNVKNKRCSHFTDTDFVFSVNLAAWNCLSDRVKHFVSGAIFGMPDVLVSRSLSKDSYLKNARLPDWCCPQADSVETEKTPVKKWEADDLLICVNIIVYRDVLKETTLDRADYCACKYVQHYFTCIVLHLLYLFHMIIIINYRYIEMVNFGYNHRNYLCVN